MKTYKELSIEERKLTYENYQAMCEQNPYYMMPFENFEAYDKEQEMLDFDFDENTLECLG